MSDHQPANRTNNKRKRSSPFRIKVGTVVALRMQATGNSVTLIAPDSKPIPIHFKDFTFVWTAPCAGRDEGLGLLGKCIRCFLPQVFPNQKSRVLEGQIVGIHHVKASKVHLLVDKTHADAFPFLRRVQEAAVNGDSSKGAQRRAQLEERIRGADKVLLQLTLSKPGAPNEDKNKVVQWALLKLVPSRLYHETSQERIPPAENNSTKLVSRGPKLTVKHCGDGNDTTEQQISNWRWLASRYHDTLFSKLRFDQPVPSHDKDESNSSPQRREVPDVASHSAILSAGFVGVVTKVETLAHATKSLATVTLERLILPQQTACERPEKHGIYQDYDYKQYTLEVPIEQLVVIAKKLEQKNGSIDTTPIPDEPYMLDRLVYSAAYSLKRDIYFPLPEADSNGKEQPTQPCHRCRRIQVNQTKCVSQGCPLSNPCAQPFTTWCNACITELTVHGSSINGQLPCCQGRCDCRWCLLFVGSDLQDTLLNTVSSVWKEHITRADEYSETDFVIPLATTKLIANTDFGLSHFLLDLRDHPKPMPQPSTRTKPIAPKRHFNIYGKAGTKRSRKPHTEKFSVGPTAPVEDDIIDVTTCARLLDYKHFKSLKISCKQTQQIQSVSISSSMDRPRNVRDVLKEKKWGDAAEKEDKPNASSRAARANQRRFMKDVSFLGAHGLSMDSLASREPQIRFDRSKIHAWGVFADEDIAGDEMIIEYRGEIIGNAVAEKREKLYEQEKIGSDYMFRIDNLTVCDATKQGNVARFINASCDPNCYTKIITIDGSKRIVVYSKCAIPAGEELSYDYKFPLEYDPDKRIPCHCGAKECRGFMNWDKKYVTVNSTDDSDTDDSATDSPSDHSASDDDGSATEEHPLQPTGGAITSGSKFELRKESPHVTESNDKGNFSSETAQTSDENISDSWPARMPPEEGLLNGPPHGILYHEIQESSRDMDLDANAKSTTAPKSPGKHSYVDLSGGYSDNKSWSAEIPAQSDLCKLLSHAPLRKRIKMVADAEHDIDGSG